MDDSTPTLLDYAKVIEWLTNELSHSVTLPKSLRPFFDDAIKRVELGRVAEELQAYLDFFAKQVW